MTLLTAGSEKPKDYVHHANVLLIGHNRFHHQTFYGPFDGTFNKEAAHAAHVMKWWLGYPANACKPTFGDDLSAYLTKKPLSVGMHARRVVRKIERKPVPPPKGKYTWPTAKRGKVIQYPYGTGTHGVAFNRASGTENWESERALDIGVPVGTPIIAPASGTIGQQIGSLHEGGRMAGLRCHLITSDDEFYLAHLSKLNVHAGQHVERGAIVGWSGEANGVPHLHCAQRVGNPVALIGAPTV